MPCQLLVMKQIRPNANVPFYTAPEFVKEALRTYGPPALVGERNFNNGLVRVRSLLFPTTADYENWLANPVTTANVNDRSKYNEKHGIKEIHQVFEVPGLDLLGIPS
jgi:hypothetical protein